MIAFLIGLLTFFQPQVNLPSQDSILVVLHDSLAVQGGEVLSLTDLDGWEFTTENIEDSANSVQWIKLQKPLSEDNALLDSLWNGFGYFRLKFKVDSTFSTKEALLRFSSFRNVSTEIYLNNKSILKIGNPSSDKEREEIVSRYTGMGQPVNLNPDKEYILVIKKSYHRYSQYNSFTNLRTVSKPYSFSLSLASPNYVQTYIEREKIIILIAGISVSVIFILSVLYLILYFRVKNQKENLWLVLLMASIGSVALNNFLNGFTIHSFWIGLGLDFFLQNLLTPFSIVLVPLVTHKLLKVKAHIFWKLYVIIGTVLYFLRIDFLGELTFFYILLISLTGGLIAIYKAFKQGVRDTVIPAFSILGVPLIVIVGLAIDYFGFSQVYFVPVLTLFLYNTLPVGLSIYQGKKFLRLNTEMEDLVTERTTQLEIAYKQLEESLSDLKATQAQLVQQEKLASLGQLTAGIAHEIKNPLNFVNNFSEVSSELIDEAFDELEKLEDSEEREEITAILDDVKSNLIKVLDHGKRANGIVTSMLQHSRGGDGKMDPTDLNALLKEYVNLSFHGMRAGKNPINVDIDLQLEEGIGKVNLITEDFSRVIVNLCNNAFDAMREKTLQGSDSYQPKLTVRTKSEGNQVRVEVEDNGPGIPDEIKDKILQPFFTTKKGTEGTGLGLSITNDIIKAHGGTIEIQTNKNQGSPSEKTGTVFFISIPVN